MDLLPEHITIAVTVYSRREFVLGAIRSALEQTIPVKVIVVEDCGPDPVLRTSITEAFGDRIQYFRNARNRGLFDNWNACMEYCTTPWLSILHDDDTLRPDFVEAMLELARRAPDRGIYFGRSSLLIEGKEMNPPPPVQWRDWREINLCEFADECFVMFPGQLFRVAAAQAVGGVQPRSYLTGDWDLWFKIAARFGGAQTARETSTVRSHYGIDRGSSRVERMGWKWALDNVQRKRNLVLLGEQQGVVIPFDRTKLLECSPIPSRLLLRYAHRFSRRILKYNAWLFTHSKPPNISYAMLQWVIRLLGPGMLRKLSFLWNKRFQLLRRL